MKEGFWVNFQTDKRFEVNEHEMWIREPKNAKKLGLSPSLIKMFGNFTPVKDRDKFLLFLMKQAPIMRVRGHGGYVSFEFSTHSRNSALDTIWLFGKEFAGPFTTMNIVNFATGEKLEISFQSLDEAMESGGADAVLRVASKSRVLVKSSISRCLARLAREILVIE